MPRVSIGLPVYNGANYIADAIRSVQKQTFADWELIISDNQSTDATAEICRQFADSDDRIKPHVADQNHGAAWNFNRTFELASGELFRWLSHDDALAPECLAKCVATLDKNPEAVLCSTGTTIIDSNGSEVLDTASGADRADHPEEDSDPALPSNLHFQELTPESEARRVEAIQSSSLPKRFQGVLFYSRRCYEVYGLVRRDVMARSQLHPSYCGGEKVWLAEMAMLGKLVEIPDRLFYCRWHDERFTANSSALQQAQHMRPLQRRRRLALPHQYRSTLGYLQLVFRSGVPFGARLHCLWIWLRFVLRFRKLGRIFLQTFQGRATSIGLDRSTQLGRQIIEPEGPSGFANGGTASRVSRAP